jgi:hypothetical protein
MEVVTMRAFFVALGILVALGSTAFAQTPPLEPSFTSAAERAAFWARQPSPSTEALPAGWQRRHAGRDGWIVERIQTVLTSPLEPTAPAPDLSACSPRPNPYTEPERAYACALAMQAQPPALTVFEVGRSYVDPYGDLEIVVLSVTRTMEGRTVVTAQITRDDEPRHIGSVLAFIVTLGAGKWQAVTR